MYLVNIRLLVVSTAVLFTAQTFGFPLPVGMTGHGVDTVIFPVRIVARNLVPPVEVHDAASQALLAAAAETARLDLVLAGIDAGTDAMPQAAALRRPAPVPAAHRVVQDYIDMTAARLDGRIREAMKWIDGADRRLLALKYYLRRNDQVDQYWAWTPQQIIRYRKTAEYRAAMADVAKVKVRFAELNPGYTLQVNTEVRMLEDQIAVWNGAPSVAASGRALLQQCMNLLDDSAFAGAPDVGDVAAFRSFLEGRAVIQVPTAAVPGFSEHGQLRAFDFVIRQGDQIVAGTDASSVRDAWDRPGWTEKLKEAVTQASSRFVGPLAAPREPWHYSYRS